MSNKKYKSVAVALRSKGKSCEEFETMLGALTFEEILSLKLELSLKWTRKKLFGYPMLKSFHHIVRESLLIFAYSACSTNNEASSMLGITKHQYKQLLKKYKIREFFKKSD